VVIQINRQSGEPAYLQIAGQIKNLIAVGRLQPGERLSPIRGVIATRRGLGSFVSDQPDQSPLAQRRSELLSSIFSKPFVEALGLGYSMYDIEEAVIQQLTRWWTETRNLNPARSGKEEDE